MPEAREKSPNDPSVGEQDLVTYFDRLKVFGVSQTLQWLVAKHGKQ